MLRLSKIGLFALLALAGCKDWTRVPPPPVALTALQGAAAPSAADFPVTPAASRVRLLRAVPPGALATLHVPDIAGTRQRFAGTTLSQLLRSPEMKQVLARSGIDPERLTGLGAVGKQGPGGLDLGKLDRALNGEVVLSLADLEWSERTGEPAFKALAAVSVAGAEHEMQQLLDFVVLAMGNDPRVQIEQGSLKGTSYSRFRISGPVTTIVEAAIFRDALLVGVGSEIVTEAIARLDSDAVEALPDDASFGRCMQRVGDANDVFRVHVDLAGLHARFRDRIPPGVQSALDMLGFEHMKAVSFALGIDGKDLVSKSFLDSPGGNDFFSELLRRHTVDRSLLERIPGAATSFSLFTLDGEVVLERLRATLGEKDLADLEASLAALKKSGHDLENDILPAFGPRVGLVTVRAGRRDAVGRDALWNQLMGTAFVIEMRDAKRAHEQLAKLPESGESLQRTREEIAGHPVTIYRFPRENLPSGFAIVVAPVGPYLMVALSRETMEQMMQSPAPETVKHFREMIRDVPETAVALSYDDLSQSSNVLAIAVEEGMRKAQGRLGAKNEGPPLKLPSLAAHGANPSVSYTLANEHGVFMTTRSPTGGLTEIGGLTGFFSAASIVLPALAAERVQLNESEAIRSMEAIRSAMGEYRAALVRDADADGEGEYAFLAELAADENARAGSESARALLHGFTRTPLGYERMGYYCRAYRPAEDGSPIGEHEPAKRRAEADGDLAENIVVVVAWPVHAGVSGRRAFLLDARNEIFYCDGGDYGGDNAPRPDVLSSQEGNLAAKPIEKHTRARDGNRWIER